MPWTRLVFVMFASLLCAASVQAEAPGRNAHWQAFEDPSGQLALEDIRSARLSADFKSVDGTAIRTLGNASALWLRQSLKDNLDLQYLVVIAPFLSDLDLYVLQAGELIQHTQTGSRSAQLQRQSHSRNFLLAIPQSRQPLTLYLRLSSPYTLRPLITLAPASEILADEERTVLLAGLLGALAMLTLYNLIRFCYLRNAPSLWLTTSLATLLLSAMHQLGMVPDWLSLLQPMQSPLGSLIILLCMFSMTGFFRSFLSWPQPHSFSRRTLGAAMVAIAISLPLPFLLDPPQATLLVMLSGCLLLSLLIITCLHGKVCSRPLLLAITALAVAVLISISGIGFFYNVPPFTWINQTYWLLAGTLISAIFFSLALTAQQLLQLKENIHSVRKRAAHLAEIKAKTDFLAHISHDIRTPMNGVLGMAELLLGTPLSGKQRDYALTIRSAGNELLSLLGQILDVSRLESGTLELDNDQIDYPSLLDDCLDIFRPQAEQQGVELINLIKPDVPNQLCSDAARLRQIVLGLLESAFKRAPAGEILITSEIDCTGKEPRLRLSVQDNGSAFSTDEREELLNAQLHSEDCISDGRLGVRLPLIIARQLTKLMGGEFGVNSSQGAGNLLWISLPLNTSSTETPLSNSAPEDLRGIRILVVDDNDTCRKVLTEQCANWGMQAYCAATGNEALALLRTKANLGEAFDVALLDQRMPGMSGMQLAAAIKTDSNLKHDILLIMLSGISDAPGKLATRNAGIRRILTKPVAGFTLLNTLRSELGRRSNHLQPDPHAPTDVPADQYELRVLVAEDNTISVKVISAMLQKLGVQPDVVSNGAEALRAMQSYQYDLVLMDCEMPVMDGFTATEKLRAWEYQEKRPHTPIIALTAHILSEHKEHARRSGMDDHIGKPVELSQLRELVERWSDEKLRRTQSLTHNET